MTGLAILGNATATLALDLSFFSTYRFYWRSRLLPHTSWDQLKGACNAAALPLRCWKPMLLIKLSTLAAEFEPYIVISNKHKPPNKCVLVISCSDTRMSATTGRPGIPSYGAR